MDVLQILEKAVERSTGRTAEEIRRENHCESPIYLANREKCRRFLDQDKIFQYNEGGVDHYINISCEIWS